MARLLNFAITAFSLMLAILFLPTVSSGQQGGGTGSVSGHVRGPGGVSVPGATIILTEKQTGERKETWTDEAGNYSFGGLAPGTYKLSVGLVGFRDDVRDPVPVKPDAPLKLNIALVMARPEGTEMAARQGSPGGAGGARNLESLPPDARARLRNQAMQGGGAANGFGGGVASGSGGGMNGDLGADATGVRFAQGAATGGQGESENSANGAGGLAESGAPGNDAGASTANSFLLAGSVSGAPGGEGGDFQGRRGDFQGGGEGPGGGGFGGGGGGFGGGGGGGGGGFGGGGGRGGGGGGGFGGGGFG